MPAAAYNEMVAYIRDAAIKRGIDPETALTVAKAEALNVFDPTKPDRGGDEGSSFGPFQLHYAGMSKSMPNAGLGDEFTARTGLDARDPSTWKQQVDFALDYAKANSWRPWMGASAAGIGARQGLGDTKALAATPDTAYTTKPAPLEVTGRKGEEVWAKPETRVRHPQNPQVGTGGYVAPGAPGAPVTADPLQTAAAVSELTGMENNPWSSLASGLAASVRPFDAGMGQADTGQLAPPELDVATPAPPVNAAPEMPLGGEIGDLAGLFKVGDIGQGALLNVDRMGQPIIKRQYG
jgi:hypothetical protein